MGRLSRSQPSACNCPRMTEPTTPSHSVVSWDSSKECRVLLSPKDLTLVEMIIHFLMGILHFYNGQSSCKVRFILSISLSIMFLLFGLSHYLFPYSNSISIIYYLTDAVLCPPRVEELQSREVEKCGPKSGECSEE